MEFPQEIKPKKTPAVLTVLGSILSLGPVAGIIFTVTLIIKAVQTANGDGMGNPEALAREIGSALVGTAVGLILLPIGIILLIFGIRGMIKQNKNAGA